jgi:DNA-binding GntR family transcriptional regulator
MSREPLLSAEPAREPSSPGRGPDLGNPTTLAGSRSTLVDDVARIIRESIFSGRIPPGSKLQQEATAAQLGISRLPVRQAFIKLESEGLVYQLGNRGTFVAPLAKRDILDHFVLFGMVSGHAAAATAEQLTDEMLANLERLNERSLTSSTAEERIRANWAFHAALNKGGASRRTLAVLKSMSNTIPQGRFAVEDLDEARVEHEAILAALRAHDPAAAQAAVVAHLRSSGERTVAKMDESGFWGPDNSA